MSVTAIFMLMVAALAGVAAGNLAPSERSYNILILLPVSAQSHTIVHVAVAEALVERGHQVRPDSHVHRSHMKKGCLTLLYNCFSFILP